MRYLIVILALATGLGCASTIKAPRAANTDVPLITLDFTALEEKQAAHFYLAYSIAKSIWEPVYLQDGSPDLFAREVYARASMLQVWKEGSANEPHPALERMQSIKGAGYLREFIWVQYHDAFKSRPAGLDLNGFWRWLEKHPDDQLALNKE